MILELKIKIVKMKPSHKIQAAILIIVMMMFSSHPLFAASITIQDSMYKGGIGIGSIIAIVASWSRNKSVLWAIFHAILGWFYVIYYVITR